MDIGKKIKELRVAKGLTQEELADRSELSKGFISQLERDLHLPVHCDIDGHFAVPGHNRLRIFSGRAGRSDCISK